jgi:predicted dehydrogenase
MDSSRRQFLAGAAATAAGAFFIGEARGQSPNARLGIGVIGCGNRGTAHLDECLKKSDALNVEIRALCDVWKVNLEKAAGKVKEKTGQRPKTFQRYADLLALPEIDGVFIVTPDFAHCPILVDAAKAKKHAYVEKPMAARLEDANAAVDAVTANQVVCQVGNQRRSEGRHIAAAKLIQSGVLGKMIKCECAWHDNGPRWERPYAQVKKEDVDWDQYLMYLLKRPFDPRMYMCWHLYKDCTVGLVGLLGSHLIDVAIWYTDDPLPRSAVGMGAKVVWTDREHFDTQDCLFAYPKGFLLQWSSRLANKAKIPENIFFGANGTFDTESWTARGEGGGKEAIKDPIKVDAAPSTGHIENWIDCIRTKNVKTNADVHVGYAHSVASFLGSLACDTGRRMAFDSEKRAIKEG